MTIHLRTLQMLALLARAHNQSIPRRRLAERLEISERQLRRDVGAYQRLRRDAPAGLPVELPSLETELRDGRAWIVLQVTVEAQPPSG